MSETQYNRSTDLSHHKKKGKILQAPLNEFPMKHSSWVNDGLPDMLWAVLLIGNLEREKVLEIFRKVAAFVKDNTDLKKGIDLSDITHSGMKKWSKENRIKLITMLKNTHPKSSEILQPLIKLHMLPSREDWEKVVTTIKRPKNEAYQMLAMGVMATLNHQSQESTDCRWIKVLCLILCEKLFFTKGIDRNNVRGVIEYPNYGEMESIRPFIRGTEIASRGKQEKSNGEWREKFWQHFNELTHCKVLPREKKTDSDTKISPDQIDNLGLLLGSHFRKTDKSSKIEAKHDATFGFGFYVLRLLYELTITNLSIGVMGRIIIRTSVEAYITLAYLIEKDDETLWENFRSYGIGKMKATYLKCRDMEDKPSFINEKFLKEAINEDRWEELSDINIGHWGNSDLRQMSIEAKCKEVYDAYYEWGSCFSHGNWAAMREVNFDKCANPFHRLHLIPSLGHSPLPSALDDMVKITNLILGLIDSQYPTFDKRIEDEKETKSANT